MRKYTACIEYTWAEESGEDKSCGYCNTSYVLLPSISTLESHITRLDQALLMRGRFIPGSFRVEKVTLTER